MAKLLDFPHPSNDYRWTDLDRWSVSGRTMTLTTQPSDHNASGAELALPGRRNEMWLTYRVRFSEMAAFGRNQKAHSVGGKMPGLASSGPFGRMNGNYTGGNHDDQGFSGRLMWRGWNSRGQSWEPADGFGFGVYAYDYELATDPNQKYGRQIMFRDDDQVRNPQRQSFDGENNGTSMGRIGDSGVWLAPVGEWITVTLGYRVGASESDNWFEAWVSTENEPTPMLRLRLDNGFRWMAPTARQEIDTFLFQSYWGGKGDIWLPDRPAQLSYANIEVHDSNPLIPLMPPPPITEPPSEQPPANAPPMVPPDGTPAPGVGPRLIATDDGRMLIEYQGRYYTPLGGIEVTG